MTNDDTRHTLACCRREKAAARAAITKLSAQLADAYHQLGRAISGEQTCLNKLDKENQ